MYILFYSFLGYILAGVCFSFIFLLFYIRKIDSLVKKSSIGFFILILPGIIILWPVVFIRLFGFRKQIYEKNT